MILVIEDDVCKTRYGLTDVVGFVEEHRPRVVAELAHMVAAWLEAGWPACEEPAQQNISKVWAATMYGFLWRSRLKGSPTDYDESSHALDPRYELMLDIALPHPGRWTGLAGGGPSACRICREGL